MLTNEEFQNLVLGELRGINEKINNLEGGQIRLENRLERLENKLDAVYDQTEMLTEFRTEAIIKLDKLMEDNRSFHEIIGRHEVDIATLKRKYA